MNTTKMFIGTGYLSIPNIYASSGWLGGMIMIIIVGALNCITMLQMLKVADLHPKVPSYSELSRVVLGKRGKIIVDISIWIMQMSCCISYLYFIGK